MGGKSRNLVPKIRNSQSTCKQVATIDQTYSFPADLSIFFPCLYLVCFFKTENFHGQKIIIVYSCPTEIIKVFYYLSSVNIKNLFSCMLVVEYCTVMVHEKGIQLYTNIECIDLLFFFIAQKTCSGLVAVGMASFLCLPKLR